MFDVRHFDGLGNMPAPWHGFISAVAPTFDLTLPWLLEFERRLVEPAQRLHVIAVSDRASGAPVALLPLRTDSIAIGGPVKVPGLTALSNYYTALFRPLATPGRESEVAEALVKGMLEARPRTTVVDLNPLNADDPLIAAMEVQFAKRGFSTERYFRFGNWYLPLEQRSSAEYLKSLPGQVRSTLQRKGKKLRATPNTVIRVVTDVAEVPAAMDAYESVYRSSWKVDEPHKDFIRAIVSDFARRGWLRLGLIEIGSRPAAAQIWFVYGGTASIFKLAYDEEFAALSVGSALTLALMQHVIDLDCVATVDYLCGDDSYKRDWMSTRRERIGLRAIRRVSLTGALDAAARVARRFRRKRSPS